VESYRDKGKVRQRTLLSLGKVGEDRLDDLIAAISKHKDVISTLEAAKSISIEDTYILGPLLVIEHLFERFGITAALERITKKHPKIEFNFLRIIFTLVVCRFIKPGSKLKIFEYLQDKLYPVMMSGKDELHHIYRALDVLCEHKEDVEQELYWHQRDLLNMNIDVVLYDLTTLRFESTREDIGDLRRFGYSKEMRSDCTQVVLGLLVDPNGIPLGFEVHPGNTFEGNTLDGIVSRVRNKFKVRRFIFVADRGLFSAKNLNFIRNSCGINGEAGEFIVGMKLGQYKKRHKEFYDLSRFTYINDELAFYETTHEGDRCIVTWSKARAERDRKTREDILGKIKEKLTSSNATGKTFVTNSNYKKYLKGLEKSTPQINEKSLEKEAEKDGFFGVITNIADKKMVASEIIAAYKHLWIIEDAFGEVKGSLKARPVYHWTDDRIVGHLTLCFLAYFCEAQITKVLREKQVELESLAIEQKIIEKRPLTVVEAMRELVEVRAFPVSLRGHMVWVRSDIKGNAAKLLKAIGVAIPSKLLTMVESPPLPTQSSEKSKCSGTNQT
jgi:hypothetical protein